MLKLHVYVRLCCVTGGQQKPLNFYSESNTGSFFDGIAQEGTTEGT